MENTYCITLADGTIFMHSLSRDAYRRSRVTNIVNSAASTPVETLSYSYDALNRPISRNANSFGYNDHSEVTSTNISGFSNAYDYDEIGNLLLFAQNIVTNLYTANNLNQYTSILRDSVSPCEPSYDADGNLLSDGVFTFTYDAANRLKTISSNGVLLVTNFYDAKSRRVRKVTPNATTTFFYDDWNLIEERIAYTNGATSTIHYYWGKDLSGTSQGVGGVGGLLYLAVNDSVYIPFYDNNGNITRYLDYTGETVATYTYDAFGNTISQSGPLADFFHHRFSTKYYDSETGLYYYGYRFYHPILMRWLNREDPLEESGGCNLCAFCNNSPLYMIDPLGDIAVTDIPGIMDNKKWSVGAALMRYWLSLDSRATTIPNETIVKMNWGLGFDRAKTVCDKIFYEKQYVNQATRKEIIAMIKRTLRGAEGSFCLLNRPASQVEADYVNTRPVGNIFDPLDDMLAALGRVNLRMAVSGYVKWKCAFFTSVGVYVRDSYDFVDEQSLGYWNSRTNYAGRNFRKGDKVSNASFRDYAKKTGKAPISLFTQILRLPHLKKRRK